MGKKRPDKFRARSKEEAFKRELKGLDSRSLTKDKFVVLTFKDLDINQGQGVVEWEDEKLLALAFNKLRAICQMTVKEVLAQQIITNYEKIDFPPNSKFYHPKHIPVGVTWASLHIQGKECIIGYFEDNIFHVVFMDKNHEFWITEKKHT
ncbi:MAG: hypothetical protein IPN39_09095 [Chitinophagaceae bacterium]|nr:hypothetical protein [Chitinophagaceae bacterium]